MVAGRDGSLTLFENENSMKTIELGGKDRLVRLISGEIVSAATGRQLAVLNQNLDFLKTFKVSEYWIRTLTGNENHIVLGDADGEVRYYQRHGNVEPKVSKVLLRKFIFRFTAIKNKSTQ